MKIFSLMLFVSFIIASNAQYLQIVQPVTGQLYDGSTILLGKVGPGESFYVLASASTTNTSGKYVNLGWNTFQAVSLPQGWAAQSSPLYEDPMKLKITVAPNAPNGTYLLVLRAVNVGNYSRLGNLTIKAYINVTPNVFNLNVTPTVITTGLNQPANLHVVINNIGASDDPFIINAYGLPAWNISDSVIALHSTINTFIYPVFVSVPGIYNFNLTVTSSSSPLIQKIYQIKLIASPGLLNDYSAVGQGALLSPIIYEPAYSAMLLLHEIAKALGFAK